MSDSNIPIDKLMEQIAIDIIHQDCEYRDNILKAIQDGDPVLIIKSVLVFVATHKYDREILE